MATISPPAPCARCGHIRVRANLALVDNSLICPECLYRQSADDVNASRVAPPRAVDARAEAPASPVSLVPDLSAYCFACRRLTPMVPPAAPLVIRNGVAVREGACRRCGAATSRIGGARGADEARDDAQAHDGVGGPLFEMSA